MKLQVARASLLKPIQLVTGVVERRHTLPILANVLLSVQGDELSLTGTDLEVEIVAHAKLEQPASADGAITLPARKLSDIWRSLPDDAMVTISVEKDRAVLRSGRSRFALATLPASEYPTVDVAEAEMTVSMETAQLRRLIDRTSFSMAQQDVRYFLNGLLLEVTQDQLRAVATDGHRLAMCSQTESGVGNSEVRQAIVPRKGVFEISRLLGDDADSVEMSLGSNHLSVKTSECALTTKLVDGKFPDYEKVIPRDGTRVIKGDRETLRLAFARAAILSNEKYRSVRITLNPDQMTIQANNPEQEEAEEVVEIECDATELEIGFNVSYLQDVLGAIGNETIKMTLADTNSSALIEPDDDDGCLYVVMPVRL